MRSAPKQLHFPLAGLAKDGSFRVSTEPTETRVYSTPAAVNVIGPCPFAKRSRGGSRPNDWLGTPFPRPEKVIYRARKVVKNGATWMMSRTGKEDDFDFGGYADSEQIDVGSPVAGNTGNAGQVGAEITAFIPIDDRMIFICAENAIHLLQGEPTTGQKSVVSSNVGVVSANAWCFDSQTVYFVGGMGVYAMVPGESPLLLSQKLPEDLKGVSEATLDYDAEYRGIHIYTDKGDYFYDIAAKAFWPMDYASEKSSVVIGPYRLSQNDAADGFLDELTAAVAWGSSAVTLEVFTAHTAEEVVREAENEAATSRNRFTINQGFNGNIRPRVRGAWCALRLSSEGEWAYENILSVSKLLGRLR